MFNTVCKRIVKYYWHGLTKRFEKILLFQASRYSFCNHASARITRGAFKGEKKVSTINNDATNNLTAITAIPCNDKSNVTFEVPFGKISSILKYCTPRWMLWQFFQFTYSLVSRHQWSSPSSIRNCALISFRVIDVPRNKQSTIVPTTPSFLSVWMIDIIYREKKPKNEIVTRVNVLVTVIVVNRSRNFRERYTGSCNGCPSPSTNFPQRKKRFATRNVEFRAPVSLELSIRSKIVR